MKIAALGFCLVLTATATAALAGERVAEETEEDDKRCSCSGPECQCCVSFNLTYYVDLGGPGCVRMKYLSKDEGLMVNVSYGDKQLHTGRIMKGSPTITCRNLLMDLASMCVKFSHVEVTETGMKACASLVPAILNSLQDGFQLGCFDMGPQEMRLINSTFIEPVETSEATAALPETAEEEPDELESAGDPEAADNGTSSLINEEALISAVNESAEEGIAWFGSFLGFNFGKSSDNQTTTTQPPPNAS